MLALKIISGILLFLLILLLCPVRLEVSFREEFFLTLRYLFLKIPLVPGKEELEEEEQQKEEETEAEEKEKGSTANQLKDIIKRNGFFGFISAVFDLVKIVARSTKRLISHIRWKYFDLYLCVGGAKDAGEAAILYGQLSAGIASALGILFSLTKCEKKAVSVDLDYDLPENVVDFSAKLSLRPIFAVRELFSLLIHGIPVVWKVLRAGKGRRAQHRTTAVQNSEKRKVTRHE